VSLKKTKPQLTTTRVVKYLEGQKLHLEKQLSKLTRDDPYLHHDWTVSSEPGGEALEYEGHERITLVKANLAKGLDQVKRALSRLRRGSYGKCEKCAAKIDEKRLEAFPEATLCLKCESKAEKQANLN